MRLALCVFSNIHPNYSSLTKGLDVGPWSFINFLIFIPRRSCYCTPRKNFFSSVRLDFVGQSLYSTSWKLEQCVTVHPSSPIEFLIKQFRLCAQFFSAQTTFSYQVKGLVLYTWSPFQNLQKNKIK